MNEQGARSPGRGVSVGAVVLVFLVLAGLLAPGFVLYRRQTGTTRRLAEARLQQSRSEADDLQSKIDMLEAENRALRAERDALKRAAKGEPAARPAP
jgi:outer membrane murein-binding lipoprotein Lpp